jgi:hypothetical protein
VGESCFFNREFMNTLGFKGVLSQLVQGDVEEESEGVSLWRFLESANGPPTIGRADSSPGVAISSERTKIAEVVRHKAPGGA